MIKSVVLTILDGWAHGPDQDNAIKAASTPIYNQLLAQNPHTTLKASGIDVGLPPGQMGNSEVGHLNIGAGRVIYQELTRINKSIEDGDFFDNPHLNQAMEGLEGKSLHLLGLLSDGGVHSHRNHLEALIRLAKIKGVGELWIHPLLDGRDVAPRSALDYLNWLELTCRNTGLGSIATVGGRYWGMDRDKRWERTQRAYDAIVLAQGPRAESAVAAVEEAYSQDITDEFVPHTIIDPRGNIKSGDSVIFFNFRPDRARQLSRALVDEEFAHFKRPAGISLRFLSLTQYDETIKVPVAFAPQSITHTLGQVISEAGLSQLRIAETEKYAHVTYFFNGGDEARLPGEDRVLIPSPKVATYDLQPEMSAVPLTDEVCTRIASGQYSLIVLNYANPDMVGHSGNFQAAVKACEVVDQCLGRVVNAVSMVGGALIVTSDHGNAEQMRTPEGSPHTAHTSNPVPLILRAPGKQKVMPGALCDIAPTILDLLGLNQPPQMTGKSLIRE